MPTDQPAQPTHSSGPDHPLRKDEYGNLIASSIHEESEYVAKQRCQCGGTYRKEGRELWGKGKPGEHSEDDRYYDLVCYKCVECGEERKFLFNVTELFAEYEKMPSENLLKESLKLNLLGRSE